jgi:PAS domain S-box-containing protein
LLSAVAITFPLLLLLGALIFRSASVERQQLEQRVLQVLGNLVDDIDRDFERHLTILQTLATSQALKNEDWRAFYDQAKAGLQGRAYLILIDSTGRQLVNTYVPYGEQPAMTGDPETLRRMIETKTPVVSGLFTSLVVKKPVFNVSIPVLSDGQLRYVMSLGLLPDDLVSLLASQRLGPEWVTMVWDANGILMARSRDNARYLGSTLPPSLRQQGRRTIVRTANLDGEDVVHATGQSRISGWGVAVNVPYRLISEQLRYFLLLSGVAAALVTALALALGWLFARQITMSLAGASEAAAAFGHGYPVALAGSRLKEADSFLRTLRAAQLELSARSAALGRAQEQFRLAVEAAPNGMILADRDGQIILVNEQAEKLFGYDRSELLGQRVEMLVPERFRARHPADRQDYAARPVTRLMGSRDVFARRKDGTEIPVEIGLSPIVTEHGTMVLSAVVDITDRKKAQESQQLVVGELKHRTQNLLTVVQSIANRSIDETKTPAEAKIVLGGRLRALASAYAELSDAKWEGVPLRAIIDRQIGAMSNRIGVAGCDIIILPSAAQQFAMIVHELATNALKYGALSVPGGSVSIEGKIVHDEKQRSFLFTWKESGGPAAVQPTRKGFGSVVLVDSARHFAENVSADFLPAGFSYNLQVRLDTIEAKPTARDARHDPLPPKKGNVANAD